MAKQCEQCHCQRKTHMAILEDGGRLRDFASARNTMTTTCTLYTYLLGDDSGITTVPYRLPLSTSARHPEHVYMGDMFPRASEGKSSRCTLWAVVWSRSSKDELGHEEGGGRGVGQYQQPTCAVLVPTVDCRR